MNFNNKNNHQNEDEKEFLEFQDGKIKSYKKNGEQEKEVKTNLNVNDLKSKTEKKVKEIGPIKLLKIIGGIALVLFTIYVGISVYKTFTETPPTLVDSETGEEKSVDDIKKENDKVTKAQSSLLISFNAVNNDLYTYTISDFARLEDYEKNLLNRVSFSNAVKNNLTSKNKVLDYLIANKKQFSGDVTEELIYETLLSRVKNSIALSEGIMKELDLSVKQKQINVLVEDYNMKETTLKNNEILLLKKYLDKENIPYTFDNDTNTLQYDF